MKTIFRLIVRLGIIAIILVGIQKVLTTPRYLQAIMPYVNQVEELLEKKTNSVKYTLENGEQKSKVQTDNVKYDNNRWPNSTATVYIDIDDSTLYNAFVSAIKQWNNTGAFTFKIVNDKKDADIVGKLMENNDGTAGTTDTTTDEQTKRIIKATVYLNRYYLESATYGYSEQRIINTAEHELGHAIGLDHTDEVSVMQPAGSYYTIQPRDVDVVKKLYQEN